MSPVEAYEALMLFARRRGEGALRLAMHAAVPQSFRPDLLHLLKLNFLPRELHDPAAEADVLFSPLCEEVGRGYFEFGAHARTLLLDNLAANYAADRTPRIARVANFLLHYVEHMERRAAGGLDRLWRDYLEVQRWVALAFLDPDAAARQLAAALKGTSTPGGEFAARLRLGGLASALSSPLVKYRHVLNYAAGLQALEAGDHARAQTLLSGLGDEDLNVGGILLRPATELLRAYAVPAAGTTEPEVEVPAQEEVAPAQFDEESFTSPPGLVRILCATHQNDQARFLSVAELLREPQTEFHLLPMTFNVAEKELPKALLTSDAVLILGTPSVMDALSPNSYINDLIKLARAQSKPTFLLHLGGRLNEAWSSSGVKVISLPTQGGQPPELRAEIDRIRKDKEARENFQEKIRGMEALTGSDEPHVLETLTEAVWREEDARVRLTAVVALSKSRNETALEALIVAAGDANAEVRGAAAEALSGSGVNAVLIFGFFGTDHVENREVLREELRRRGYVPLVIPFTRPTRPDTAEMMRVAAPLTYFAIADLTAPPEIQLNLVHYLGTFLQRLGAPVVLLTQRDPSPIVTARVDVLRQRYHAVLPLYSYGGPGELREAFDRIVTEPVAAKLRESSESDPADDGPSESVEWKVSAPSFTYDIVFSYAHQDNLPSAEGRRGWVTGLYEQLGIRLTEMTGAHPAMWMDAPQQGSRHLSVSMWSKMSDTLLLVIVFSPDYVESEWCRQQLRAFTESAESSGGLRPGGRSRIFKVVRLPAEGGTEELRELLGYEFFEHDESGGRPRELSPDMAPSFPIFRDKLEDFAWDIKRTLDVLKYGAGPGSTSEIF